jgi:hypothetical protein
MTWMQAVGWGLAGGLAAGVLALMTAVTAAGFRWPWRRSELGPRLFVLGCGLLLGALVAAAAHGQISGPWPAFAMGAGAPATIRGLLSGIEVHPKGIPSQSPRVASSDTKEPNPGKEGVNEIAS